MRLLETRVPVRAPELLRIGHSPNEISGSGALVSQRVPLDSMLPPKLATLVSAAADAPVPQKEVYDLGSSPYATEVNRKGKYQTHRAAWDYGMGMYSGVTYEKVTPSTVVGDRPVVTIGGKQFVGLQTTRMNPKTRELETVSVEQFLLDDLVKLTASSHVLDLGSGQNHFINDMVLGENPFSESAPHVREFLAEHRRQGLGDRVGENFKTVGRPNMTGVTTVPLTAEGSFGSTGGQFFQDKRPVFLSELEATGKAEVFRKYFEDVSVEELTRQFGKVDLVTDLFGVFSYSANTELIVDKLSQVMKPGARLWISHINPEKLAQTVDFMVASGKYEPAGSGVLVRTERP